MRSWTSFALLAVIILFSGCSVEPESGEHERLEQARSYWEAGEGNSAIIEIKNILQKNPENGDARFLFGKIYVRYGRGEDAEQELLRAIEYGVSPEMVKPELLKAQLLQNKNDEVLSQLSSGEIVKNADLMVLKGVALMQSREFNRARDNLNQALQIAPDSVEALVGLAQLALAENRLVDSRELVRRALENEAGNSRAWYLKGTMDFMGAQFEEASSAFQLAIENEPKRVVTPLNFLATSNLVKTLIAQKNYQEAEERLEVLLRIAPNHPLSNYLKAVLSYEIRDYETASKYLIQVLNLEPDHQAAVLLLGAINFYQGNLEQANAYLSKFVSNVPNHLASRKMLGITRIKLRKGEEALEVLSAGLDQSPKDAELMRLVGSAALQMGDSQVAKRYFKQAQEISPDISASRSMAMAFLIEGDASRAIAMLEQSIRKDQSAHADELLLAIAFVQQRDFERAVGLIDTVLAKEPNSYPALVLGAKLAEMTEKPEIARVRYRNILELRPDSFEAAISFARLDIKENRIDGARKTLNRVLEVVPDQPAVIVELANLEARAGQIGKAMKLAQRLQSSESTLALGHELEGNFHYSSRNYKKAEQSYERALLYNSAEGIAIKRFQALKEFDGKRAGSFLDSWLSRHPDHIKARVLLANMYLELGESADSIHHFEVVLKGEPEHPAILNNLAWLYMEVGDNRALPLAQKAFDNAPENPDILDTYGWILVSRGDIRKGIELLEMAFEKAPDNPMIRHHLQVARDKVGIHNK